MKHKINIISTFKTINLTKRYQIMTAITFKFTLFACVLFTCFACTQKTINQVQTTNMNQNENQVNLDTATFGAGCFWCVEAIFQRLRGVDKVLPGYAGGHVVNPTYKEVCTGTTGHAEVCRIFFDSNQISYKELLEIFWAFHDPTTLNRQGNDVGTQYRSVVFYHNEDQKMLAEELKTLFNKENTFDNKVVTEIVPISNYSDAEDYHQNYFNQNENKNPYCAATITPKVKKLKKVYEEKLKDEYK
jgi:peptide-methionine (S)-S-oxide reductase